MLTRSGRVSEYSVASSRNTSGTESVRDRVTRVEWPSRRVVPPSPCASLPRAESRRSRIAASSTTSAQPMPTRIRLAPVMLASASPHGDCSVEPGGRHVGPCAA